MACGRGPCAAAGLTAVCPSSDWLAAVKFGVEALMFRRAARRPLDRGGETEREVLEPKLLFELWLRDLSVGLDGWEVARLVMKLKGELPKDQAAVGCSSEVRRRDTLGLGG